MIDFILLERVTVIEAHILLSTLPASPARDEAIRRITDRLAQAFAATIRKYPREKLPDYMTSVGDLLGIKPLDEQESAVG